MKILVTGSRGFLGRVLCKSLTDQGHEVTGVHTGNCDLTRPNPLTGFDPVSFNQIYHLAAWTQAGDFCLKHPGEQWIINQKINTAVLEWWRDKQPEAKLIIMGTSCAYAEGSDLIETEYMVGEPVESLYTYAMTKRMLFQGARALNKQYGMSYLCAVPSTLYGPGYHTDGRQMHFIFDLIRKILRAKLFGETATLWGDGNQLRELAHVHDFVRALLAINAQRSNDIVNIGAGREYTIKEFAQKICDYVDYDFKKIEFDTSRYVGAKSKCLNVEKMQSLLPDFDYTPLSSGLNATIDWFFENPDVLSS